jgi:hypothetical protein
MKEDLMNKHGLTRNIPDPIKREVRQKYGFGCVVCGLGIYQYEHFNPEFNDAHEHSADGIILLCPNHHNKKTTHFLSKEAIEKALEAPAALVAGYSKEILDVGDGYPNFIFCGSTFKDSVIPIVLSGVPLFIFMPPEVAGGPFNLNARFFDSEGSNTLNIVNNEWMASSENWDVEIEGGSLTIRERPRRIHLILRNSSHSTIEIEKIVTIIGNRKIVGDKDKLEVFDSSTGNLLQTFKQLHLKSCTVGVMI